MCRFSKGLLGLGLALAALLWLVAGTAAHSLLLKSEPADGVVLTQSPERVIAWFSQELDTGLSTLQVVNGGGRQVDNGDGGVDLNDPDHASLLVTLPPALPDGQYTAQWTATSAEDGDTSAGQISFSVGQIVPSQAMAANQSGGPSWTGWLVGGIVTGLGVLLVIVVFVAWGRPRSSRVS